MPQAPLSPLPQVRLGYLATLCLVATLGGFLFGFDTGVISGAIEPLTVRYGLSDLMKGWVSGCVLVGCAAGVLVAGPLADRAGRKRALLLAALMFSFSAVGTAVPPNITVFIVFRMISGLGIGIASIATPLYLAEIAPPHLRGRMVAANQIAIVVGIAATSLLNYFIAQQGDEAWLVATGWRWMFAIGVAPALLFGGLLAFIPESPRWLVEHHREEQARSILARVAGAGFAAAETAAIRASLAGETGGWKTLLAPRMRRPLLLGISLAVLQQVTGINVFLYFGATIFRKLGSSSGVDAGLLQQFVINGAGVLFTLVAVLTVDRWGRRPLMLLGSLGMGVSLLAMGAMAQFTPDATAAGGRMLGCILVYIAAFSLSVGPVTWVILAEIFPTAIRGRALGLSAFCLWTADYLVTQTFPLLDAKGSWFVRHFQHAFPFYLYAGACLVLLLLVWRSVPETKGRSLEEIGGNWS